MTSTNASTLLARLGVAFCFITFGVWEIMDPALWSVYVPSYATAIAPAAFLVQVHSVVLIATALGVLSGYWPKVWTTLAALELLELCVVVFEGEGLSDVFVRDLSLLFFSASLAVRSWHAETK